MKISEGSEPFELLIEKLTFGGVGMGRHQIVPDRPGVVCFVPFVAPGELVLAQIREKKKTFFKYD